MSKRLLITEDEKSNIKNMYGITEQTDQEKVNFLKGLLKMAFSGNTSSKTSSSSTDSTKPSTSDSSKEKTFDSGDIPVDSGKIDLSKSGFNSEQQSNIKLMIDEMNKSGITNPYTQIGILSVIAKESGFKPQNEIPYNTTSNSRIRSIFGKRVSSYSDSELTNLKNDPKKFFDVLYGGRFGNAPDEGYKYRGRGFNGLTFKGNYKKYGDMVGVDLVGNPDAINDPRVAAKVAIAFFTKGKDPSSFPNFTNKDEAAKYFAQINAGGRSSSFATGPALAAADKFEVSGLA